MEEMWVLSSQPIILSNRLTPSVAKYVQNTELSFKAWRLPKQVMQNVQLRQKVPPWRRPWVLLLEGTSAPSPNRKERLWHVSFDMLRDPNAVIASMVSRNASAKALFRVRLTSDRASVVSDSFDFNPTSPSKFSFQNPSVPPNISTCLADGEDNFRQSLKVSVSGVVFQLEPSGENCQQTFPLGYPWNLFKVGTFGV